MLPGRCWCDSSLSSQLFYPGGDCPPAETSHGRTNGREQFPVRPGKFFARVAQFIERDGSNIEDEGESPSASANSSGCNVSSRRPRLERGGRECNSLHPDHFTKGRQTRCLCVCKDSFVNSNLNQQSTIMILNGFIPKWLARRLARSRSFGKVRSQMKVRQTLPTLPEGRPASKRFQDDDSPAGYRIQWRQ